MSLLKKLVKKAKKVDIFALGPSSLLYYALIFFLTPFFVMMGVLFGLKMFDYGALNYRSLLYLAIGFVTLALGYYSFFGKRLAGKIPQIFKSGWRPDRVSWVFGVTFILGVLAKIAQFLTGGYFFSGRAAATWKYISLYGVLGALHLFSLVALIIAFLWYYHLKKKGDENYKIWRNVAWGTLIFILLYYMPMCSKQHLITPLVLVLISRWYVFKRSYKSIMLVFLGVL